ncbi:ribonuclease kappa-A-like [Branchiostoma lanceolatum]|uniref:RNASEK protein n=1 Tax=Branchiostoma lanceolatum TaxID=7740 RepID=A0A8K0A0P3_BRALA|nr:RNASEK [Branchiostoma lanceolatum]
MFVICGPKLSICGFIVSIWAIIMMGLMGVFYLIKSPLLLEDIGPTTEDDWKDRTKIDAIFQQSAYNCWVVAGVYVFVGLFSYFQMRMNSRQQYVVT